jgi:hypothetical protein
MRLNAVTWPQMLNQLFSQHRFDKGSLREAG